MIRFGVDGRVAVIHLDRPQVRNAINAEMASGLEAAIDRLESDDDLWLGIISHEGPVFSAGADLKEVAAGNASGLSTARGGFAGIATRERTKPLIAAVEGPAVAGGFEIVLACDMCVASTDGSFALPEVKRSLLAVGGGLARLPAILPRAVAMEIALTGDPIDAERACDLGLVNVLCEPGNALDSALALAARVNANAPLAVRESRRLLLSGSDETEHQRIVAATAALGELSSTDDFQEGPRAFVEKRPPRWTGR